MYWVQFKFQDCYLIAIEFVKKTLLLAWLYNLSLYVSEQIENKLFITIIYEENDLLFRFETTLPNVKQMINQRKICCLNKIIKRMRKKDKFYEKFFKMIWITTNTNCEKFSYNYFDIHKTTCSYCGNNDCIHIHSGFLLVEFILCVKKWSCFGPGLYVSSPRNITIKKKRHKAVMIVDQKMGAVYLAYDAMYGFHAPYGINVWIEMIPNSYQRKEVVSLKALCYKTIWKYNICNQLPAQHPLLKELNEIIPILEVALKPKYFILNLEDLGPNHFNAYYWSSLKEIRVESEMLL